MEDFDFSNSGSESGTESDGEEKSKLIKQIENYHINFPDLINKKTLEKSKKFKKYDNSVPTEVLREDLKNIQAQVNNTGMIKDVSGVCITIAGLIQNISTKTPLKLTGPKCDLVTIVHNNKESFNQICKELMCKYDICGLVKPEIRLAMLGVQSILLVHSENSQAEKELQDLRNQTEKDMKEKSNDKV